MGEVRTQGYIKKDESPLYEYVVLEGAPDPDLESQRAEASDSGYRSRASHYEGLELATHAVMTFMCLLFCE